MKYSPSNRGFYEEWRADLPADCIDMPDDDWKALFEAQAQGALIVHDGVNLPHAEFPPPPTQDQINAAKKAEIVADVQLRLDIFAQTRGYDNIVSACSYATSQHQKYGPEGRYCVAAREQTWDALFAIEAEVTAGTRPLPSGYEEIKAELPALVWPV